MAASMQNIVMNMILQQVKTEVLAELDNWRAG